MSAPRTITSSRPHDHLYDTEYMASDVRDTMRATQKAAITRVEKVPNYGNMFSEVQKYPTHGYRIQNDRLKEPPSHIQEAKIRDIVKQRAAERERRVVAEDHTIIPSQQPMPPVSDVGGKERWRYFKRPIMPYKLQQPDAAHTQFMRMDEEAPRLLKPRPPTPKTRTVGTQSKYRDNEVQTDPFTPQYAVPAGENPELLELTQLKYGMGLPAGKHEVEMVERIRQRRQFTKQLPPITDPQSLEVRKKMLEEQEMLEWKEREKEIDDLHSRQMDALQQHILEREKQMEEANRERLEGIWKKNFEGKESALAKIQQKRIKTVRKLGDARKKVDLKPRKRDIIQDYSDPSSRVYAPLKREGQVTLKGTIGNKLNQTLQTTMGPETMGTLGPGRELAPLPTTTKDLDDLERTIPKRTTSAKVKHPLKDAPVKSTASARKAREIEQNLHLMSATINTLKSDFGTGIPSLDVQREPKKVKHKGPSEALLQHKTEKPPERPQTPEMEEPLEDDDFVASVILLQRLVRGRAAQNRMFEGKERRLELIDELRVQAVQRQQEEDDLEELFQDIEDATLEAVQGEIIGDTLDFLSNELVRIEELEQVTAMVLEAEQERRLREALESGRRQQELARRAKEDEHYRHIMHVNQRSAQVYLTSLTKSCVEQAAADIALEKVEKQAAKAREDIKAGNDPDEGKRPEDVVSQLLTGFLYQDVERRAKERRDEKRSQRFQGAASSVLEGLLSSLQRKA